MIYLKTECVLEMRSKIWSVTRFRYNGSENFRFCNFAKFSNLRFSKFASNFAKFRETRNRNLGETFARHEIKIWVDIFLFWHIVFTHMFLNLLNHTASGIEYHLCTQGSRKRGFDKAHELFFWENGKWWIPRILFV